VKCRRTILHALVGPVRIGQNVLQETLCQTCFLHLEGSAGHKVHSGASGARNIDTLFFMLLWDQYGYDKKCIGTRYVELLFLHLVASAGHIVHFGASREQIVDTIFFKLPWDRYGFNKKHFRTRYGKLVFSHKVGSVGHVVHSGAFGV
jgi:hypothetical protein